MNGDLATLLIGATAGILGSIAGYYINHFLRLKEQHMVREFEIREKGREFFHQIYGLVAQLSDFATSVLRKEDGSGNAMILSESGYKMEPMSDVVDRYKKAYQGYAKTWYETRKEGLEVFLPKSLAWNLAVFWAYAGALCEKNSWEEDRQLLVSFEVTSSQVLETLDELLGLTERQSFREKWLTPKKLRYIIRGGKAD